MILTCSNKCENKYQDEKYGTGKRVHNSTSKDNTYRCTVCSTENTMGKRSIIKGK